MHAELSVCILLYIGRCHPVLVAKQIAILINRCNISQQVWSYAQVKVVCIKHLITTASGSSATDCLMSQCEICLLWGIDRALHLHL